MIFFSEKEIDSYIEEDLPYGDLTTTALGIAKIKGSISYTTRHRTVVCGTEEVKRIFKKLGLKTTYIVPSGTTLDEGAVMISGEGFGDAIHAAWKSCGRILENASGIATRTREMVEIARSINPIINIATTRKSFPGTKKLTTKAVICGGGQLHRLGLSETIIVFSEHMELLGGLQEFIKNIGLLRQREPEKKIVAEAHNVGEAKALIDSGIDVLQCDKFSMENLITIKEYANTAPTQVKVAAAGNITKKNLEDVIKTGIDLVVTSSPYFGKPADIKVHIVKTE